MIMHSAEVRWFFLGSIPEPTKTWFGTSEEQEEPTRTDSYVVFPGCSGTSVKVREGKFEIKALRSGPKCIEAVRGIFGKIESWVKWSVELSQSDLTEESGKEGFDRLDIAKTRWLRKYNVDGSISAEVSRASRPEQGCNVELTELMVRSASWWTIGFEAFGPAVRVNENLSSTVSTFFSKRLPPPCELLEANSMSYPAWFGTLGVG